jgi:trehalose-phosphatase
MKSPLAQIAKRLRAIHRRGGSLTLLFDYDGTLAPLVSHPRLAGLAPATRRLLKQLAGIDRVHVGIVSGRGLADLREMVGLDGLCLSGSTGLEFDLGGHCFSHPESCHVAQAVSELIRKVQGALASFPGAWVETKPLGFTLHYRALPTLWEKELLLRSTAIFQSSAVRLRVFHGPKAMEITPDLGWNKGTAVGQILKHLGVSGPGLLYAGDSENDAEAFDVAAAHGGVTIGIGPEAPANAQFRLPDPASLFQLLRRLHRLRSTTLVY